MSTPTHDRYALRIESGEREGETISFGEGGATLGRRPGNTLQVLDSSVSGRHAAIGVDGDEVTIRDLGSTNGTRVAGDRVSEKRLAHGDAIHVGSYELTFLDTRFAGQPVEPRTEAASSPVGGALVDAAGEGLQRVSADSVARTSKRSLIPLLVGVMLVGGAAAAFLQLQGTRASGDAGLPVEEVEGNLLGEGYSFEEDASGFSAAGGAPVDFRLDVDAGHRGAQGMHAQLITGEFAEAISKPVPVTPGKTLEARAFVRPEGAARARLCIAFSRAAGEPGPRVEAWSGALEGEGAFTELALAATVPPGFDSAEVRVLAELQPGSEENGAVAADDVSLVSLSREAAPACAVDEMSMHLLGDVPRAANLFKIDRNLLTGVRWIDSTAPRPAGIGTISVEAAADGFALAVSFDEPHRRRVLVFRADVDLTSASVATIGETGYRTHSIAFERDDASSLLLGAERDFVRLRFERPVHIAASTDEHGFHFEVDPRGQDQVFFQVGFAGERAEAASLAHRARTAAEESSMGESLSLWSALLDDFPYEAALVEEAATSRSRLIERGLTELTAVRQEVERADFFRLADLYRQCRASAAAIARRYARSEVADEAETLVADIDLGLVELETDLQAVELGRLQGIRAALERTGSPALTALVDEYIDRRFHTNQEAR